MAQGAVTLSEVERTLWRLTGWRGEQWLIDRLVAAIREHVHAHGAVCDCMVAPPVMPPAAAPEHSPREPVTVPEGREGERAEETARVCRACPGKGPQPLEAFARDVKGRNGRRLVCRDCDRRQRAERRQAVRTARLAA